jgi:arginine decarboxylase-like protein
MDLHDYGHQHERVCRANMMLRDRIDLSMRTETGDLQNPILALRHLETQYKMGRTLALHTRDKIDRTTLATSKDMSEYLNKMRQFKNDLLQLRQPVTDDFYLIGKIVKGLPDA